MRLHPFAILCVSALLCGSVCTSAQFVPNEWTIPVNGNTYIIQPGGSPARYESDDVDCPLAIVNKGGLVLKNDTSSTASSFIYIPKASQPQLSLLLLGSATLSVTCGKQSFTVPVRYDKLTLVRVGKLQVDRPGYIRIDFSTDHSATKSVAVVKDIVLSDLDMKPLFITSDFSTHFGLRGPSVHLQYSTRPFGEAEWSYNEVTVPSDGEVMGSYYCAQGFDGGYFGIQYNSPRERRVLFSVWNAEGADDPRDVSLENKVKVIKGGDKVLIQDFGNEGSGKQCILRYPWQAGKTYKFLLHAVHTVAGSTDYTAYFYSPDEGKWILLATLRRPHTDFLVTGVYSFVENFVPQQGYITRKAFFHNVWQKDTKGEWHAIRKARFTNDDTGNRGIRVDYAGGTEGDMFYLKMGGYFGNGSLLDRALSLDPEAGPSPQQEIENLNH